MGLSLEMTEALESKPTWQIRREYTPVGMTEDDASQSTVELAPPAPPPAVVAAAPRATAPSRPMAGVVLKLLSAVFYTASDCFTKILIADDISAVAVFGIRSVLFVAVAAAAQQRHGSATAEPSAGARAIGPEARLLAARAGASALAALFIFSAIARLALGDAIALIWTNPVLASALGAAVLGEEVTRADAAGLLVSALGVLLLARPTAVFGGASGGGGGGMDAFGVSAALLGSVFIGVRVVLTRAAARRGVPTARMVLHQGGASMVVAAVALGAARVACGGPGSADDDAGADGADGGGARGAGGACALAAAPSLARLRRMDVGAAMGCGVALNLGAVWTSTHATGLLTVARGSVLSYFEVLAAAAVGAAFFGEDPTPGGAVGAALIVLGGVAAITCGKEQSAVAGSDAEREPPAARARRAAPPVALPAASYLP